MHFHFWIGAASIFLSSSNLGSQNHKINASALTFFTRKLISDLTIDFIDLPESCETYWIKKDVSDFYRFLVSIFRGIKDEDNNQFDLFAGVLF